MKSKPELPPGANKPLLRYFWARVLEDGETVETQFDTETGRANSWYPEPRNLTKVMWFPVYQEMADLMARNGEFGLPHEGPIYEVELDNERRHRKRVVKPECRFFSGCVVGFEDLETIGDVPIIHFENHIHIQSFYYCHECKNEFLWPSQETPICPKCNTKNQWECRRCGEIRIGKYLCSKCGTMWFRTSPYDGSPQTCPRCEADTGIIPAGEIKENPIFLERGEVRCPDCEKLGRPFGLNEIENLEMRSITWIETRYLIGIEDLYETCITDENVKTRML